jgi:DNA-binding response OmpR family regulator|uniref:response regulator transcription factor n=1 Tax=Agathobacter sp. TaxID=2021311 RepID=UPI004027B19D
MKILLIEDDKNLCEMLRFQLEKEHHEVTICNNGRDGLDLFLQDAYDLVLLDRMLPTMNGLLILQKARRSGISTPVIIITALGELYDRVEGLDCGADDYLVKPFAYEELAARIRSIGRRNHVYDDNNLFSYADLTYDSRLRELTGPDGSMQLSRREGRLLEVFLQNPDTTLQRLVLLSRVWGADAPVEESNLDTYIHFVRKRLQQIGSHATIETVRGIGYCIRTLS